MGQKLGHLIVEAGQIHLCVGHLEDLVVVGGEGLSLLRLGQQILMQLLAGPQAGDLDVHIHARLVAVEADEAVGNVQNPDLFAHVDGINAAGLRQRAGLQNQLSGIGDGQEGALRLRVGDGHRAAVADLGLKHGQDAAAAAQHGGKSHRHALHAGVGRVHLREQLADALGAAHDVGGVHRLVGGEQNKGCHLMLRTGCQQVFGTQNVGLDRFGRAQLHQRHLFIGCRMEHHVGVVQLHNLVKALFFPGAAHQRHYRGIAAINSFQFPLQFIGAAFAGIQNQQLPGTVPHDLAAKLAAHRTGAAHHKDHIIPDVLADLLGIQVQLLPGEEVAHIQITEGASAVAFDGQLFRLFGVGVQLRLDGLRVIEDTHPAAGGVAQVDDLPQTVAVQTGDRDDDLPDVVFAHQIRNVRDDAPDGHALNTQAVFGEVIVHQTDRIAEGAVFILAEVHRPSRRVACAHNEQVGGVLIILGRAVHLESCPVDGAQQPPQKPHTRHQEHIQHGADDEHRTADGPLPHNGVHQQDEGRGKPGQKNHSGDVPDTGVIPDDLVQTAHPEHNAVNQKRIGQHGSHGLNDHRTAHRVRPIKSQQNGEIIGQDDQTAVQQKQADAPGQILEL